MVNTRQFSGSTYMQDMTKSHTFSAKNQGSTYTPIRLIRRFDLYAEKYGNPIVVDIAIGFLFYLR